MALYDDKNFIGSKIRQLRVKAKLSQDELSEKIGMTEKNLSNIERGLQYPALNNFLRMLDVLNVSVSEFGVGEYRADNKVRTDIFKEISLIKDKDLKEYLNIIKSVKTLQKWC